MSDENWVTIASSRDADAFAGKIVAVSTNLKPFGRGQDRAHDTAWMLPSSAESKPVSLGMFSFSPIVGTGLELAVKPGVRESIPPQITSDDMRAMEKDPDFRVGGDKGFLQVRLATSKEIAALRGAAERNDAVVLGNRASGFKTQLAIG